MEPQQQPDNPELSLAFGFLRDTAENVFLTGKAGTGKTTFLHNLRKTSPKRMVVLAPTGVAAINAGGVTIHSFFQMPFGPWIPGGRAEPAARGDFKKGLFAGFHRFSREKLNIIRSVDLIVIDEISMVRADLLDGIDEILRRFRDRNRPFGGVQLLMIGDIQQLAPVVKDEEWDILKQHYDTPFFFGSKALEKSPYKTIELKKVYRQGDLAFIELLNKVRHSERDPATLEQINRRYVPGMNLEQEGCIVLTTHNHQAKKINEERMRKLPAALFKFTARIEGEFPEYSFPTDPELVLKSGAQVMFVKNDSSPEKRYFNGKIGKITSIDGDTIEVQCTLDESPIVVEPESWQNARYGLDEAGGIVETVVGTFTQYPLKAAWAITIHKSQGLTFDKVIIDAAAAFSHGQVYVALSRCRTFEGLFLTSQLTPRVLIKNSSVAEFSEKVTANQPDEDRLRIAAISYQQSLVHELFDFSPIKRRSGYLLKLLDENREKMFPEVLEFFRAMDATIYSGILEVAAKFHVQIDNLLPEEPDIGSNQKLQDRVRKAVGYFTDTLKNTCTGGIAQIESKIDLDNKDTRKAVSEGLRRFQEEVSKKSACLESCADGFSLTAYLAARARGAIEKPVGKKRSAIPELDVSGDLSETGMALYGKLRAWRRDKAGSQSVPEFMIMHQKTLIQIASLMPSSAKALKAVKGMGKRKVARFGDELLHIIVDHRGEHGGPPEDTDVPCIKEKINTRQVTLDLYRSGKTLPEIASQRNLTLTTIEGHIAYYLGNGELGIDRFLAPDKVTRLREYFLTKGNRELTPAKKYFGEECTYGELRMVLAHMDYEGAGKAGIAECPAEHHSLPCT